MFWLGRVKSFYFVQHLPLLQPNLSYLVKLLAQCFSWGGWKAFVSKYLLVLYSTVLYLNGSIKMGNIEVTTIDFASILLYYIEMSYI